MRRAKLVVLGSLNVDLILQTPKLPEPGATVGGAEVQRRHGGKGANQALAAHRQGADVILIGCLGSDQEGRNYRRYLRRQGLSDRAICSAEKATGLAVVVVDKKAENQIVVAPGANLAVTRQQIRTAEDTWSNAWGLLMQWEVPTEALKAAIQVAGKRSLPVIFNPSPLQSDFPWGRAAIQTLIVNEHEARLLTGRRSESGWNLMRKRLRVDNLIVTRGSAGAWVSTGNGSFTQAAFKVRPRDTVGAGDAFAGTFAAWQAQGADTRLSVRAAVCAGALATLEVGAQESQPSRAAVEQALRLL